MGPFDLSVQLRGSSLDVGMSDALIFDIPVELGLELMAVISPDFLDAERELFDDAIDEVDRIGLCVFVVDFERPDARRIVDVGILEPPDFLAALTSKGEELDVHLDVMTWHLFVVALGMDFADARSARQSADAVAPEDTRHTCVGDLNVVVARQIPDDPDRPEVVFAAQVKDLVDDLGRGLVGRVLGDRFGIDQPNFAVLVVSGFPAVETSPAHAEVSAGSGRAIP